jgi:hypothetical protein
VHPEASRPVLPREANAASGANVDFSCNEGMDASILRMRLIAGGAVRR